MECVRCSSWNAAPRRFCSSCGDPLPDTCAECGFPNLPGDRFCGGCGTPRPRGALRFPRAASYLREGERKHVTVLFCDIENSSRWVRSGDPEEAAEHLAPPLRAMVDAVHRFQGTLARLEGDGVMALFGAPVALEDAAVRACFAALSIRERLAKQNGGDVRVRCGLHSGEVVLLGVNEDLSIRYDVFGETPHLARRLQEHAEPDAILASARTVELAGNWVSALPLGAQRFRGLSDATEVFQISERTPHSTRWDARAARGLARFVGRQGELDFLKERLETLQNGAGLSVSISGEAGIGKSRLVHEFVSGARDAGYTVFRTGARESDLAGGYEPWATLVRDALGVEPGSPVEQVLDTAQRALTSIGLELSDYRAALETLLDLPHSEPSWEALQPNQRRNRMETAAHDILFRLAHKRPCVLLYEDVQWSDEPSRQLLNALQQRVDMAPVLLLTTSRETTLSANSAAEIELSPLADYEAGELLTFLLGSDSSLDRIKRELIDRADGNPLFLEEGVRSCATTGLLTGSPGRYRCEGEPGEWELPATVKEVIAARIDELAPQLKRCLQRMAVLGPEFRSALAADMVGGDDESDDRSWKTLVGEGFLDVAPRVEPPRYRFRHAETREVVYRSLLSSRRRELHERAMRVLENREADFGRGELLDELANHAFHGEQWSAAARYSLKACARAVRRSASREAVAHFERGRRALERVEASPERTKRAIDLRLVVLDALLPLGEQEAVATCLREALEYAGTFGDSRRMGLIYSRLGNAQWFAGDHRGAQNTSERGIAIARTLGHEDLELGALFTLGLALHGTGELREAIKIFEELLQRIPPERSRETMGWAGYPVAFLHSFLATSFVDLGEWQLAESHAETACAFAKDIGHPYSIVLGYTALGHVLLETNEATRAVKELEPIATLCDAEEVDTLYAAITARLALALARSGSLEEGAALTDRALASTRFLRGGQYTWLYLYLAGSEIERRRGSYETAVDFAGRAVALTQRNGERVHLALALRALRDAERAAGKEAAARQTGARARELATALGLKPLVAQLDG